MLILLTRLRQPCLMVVTVLMMNELHFAVDREPVGMNVQGTHEDTNQQSLVMEIFVFLCLFNDYNLSVSRRNDKFLGVPIEITDRTTVEVEYDEPYNSKNDDKYPKRYSCVEECKKQIADSKYHTCAQQEFIGSLAMYSDVFKFLYLLDFFSHE